MIKRSTSKILGSTFQLGLRLVKGIAQAWYYQKENEIIQQVDRVRTQGLLTKLSMAAEDDLALGTKEIEHIEYWAGRIQEAAPDCPTGWFIIADLMVSNRRPKEAMPAAETAYKKWRELPRSQRGMFADRTVTAYVQALTLNKDFDTALAVAQKHQRKDLESAVWAAAYPSLLAHEPEQSGM